MDEVVNRLLESEEPSVRLKIRTGVLGEDAEESGSLERRYPSHPGSGYCYRNDGKTAPFPTTRIGSGADPTGYSPSWPSWAIPQEMTR